MAAKSKKPKKEVDTILKPEEETDSEKVIEVKTSKKEKEESEVKTKDAPSDVKSDKPISSFSQLDSDEEPKKEGKKEKEEEKVEKEEEKEEIEEKKEETPKEEDTEKEEPVEEEKDESKDWTPSIEESEEVEEKPTKSKILLIVFIVAIIGLIVGGVFYYRSRVSKTDTEESTEPVPLVQEETPTPTEEPADEEVDFSKYSVSILNGSGIPGEAGKVEELITDLGFESIETGNAESYDYEKSEVSTKEDTPEAVISAIEELVKETFEVERAGTSLAEDSTYDIIIIVGTRK